MSTVDGEFDFDLRYYPNDVDADRIVECWISQGPRADDLFDPQPGDSIRAGDDELEAPRSQSRTDATPTGCGSTFSPPTPSTRAPERTPPLTARPLSSAERGQ